MKKFFLLSLLFLVGCAGNAGQKSVETTGTGAASAPAPAVAAKQEPITAGKDKEIVKVKIETTMGDIEIDLFAKKAPKTVENFVKLAKSGYYDGIIFHRVIPGFMVQTGDPTGTGTGGPGYTFADEFNPELTHDGPGVLSMANAGPNTNGSQFFITEAATPWLDGRHSVFGKVSKGIEVVHSIANVARDGNDKPVQQIAMKKVTVLD